MSSYFEENAEEELPGVLRLLFIGDIVGRPGRELIRKGVRSLAERYRVDLVIANAENAAKHHCPPTAARLPVSAAKHHYASTATHLPGSAC